jgi:hypothetical protein
MATSENRGFEPEVGVDELKADIARTRDELADTVEALVQKADVKDRALRQVAATRDAAARRANDWSARMQERPAVSAAVIIGALLLIVMWVRRR